MYTQCPKCQTYYSLTEEQLKIHDGLVRCGNCEATFYADLYLSKMLPETSLTRAHDKETTAPRHEPKLDKAQQAPPAMETEDTQPHIEPETQSDPAIPTISELLGVKPKSRTHPLLWGLGNLLLISGLLVQGIYFYSNELIKLPEIRPWVQKACRQLYCGIQPRQNIGMIEVYGVSVAPHPDYDKALRVRSNLVNRAAYPQAYPLMEISLTDKQGRIVSRRMFSAEHYLTQKTSDKAEMSPNVVIKSRLDLTSPGKNVVGYEIQLFSS
jgi:predicted Zn finger-like uncharacterized protein